jgi:hypothetical protein
MKTLTTLCTAVIVLGALTSSARAAAETGDFLRAAPAAILPPSRAPSPTIDQLSSSQFASASNEPRFSKNDPKWRRQWAISLAPLFASQALDAASSYGMRELNPLLAGPDGGFGTKATALKFGAIGALTGVEYFLVRKYPRSAKIFTIVNWTTSGATAALAVHNYRLH